MSTQEYMQKVVEDVDEDDDFNSGAWVSDTNYVNLFGGTVTGCLGDIDNFLKKGKLEQVVIIVKSCSPNILGDLIVTLKDLSCTIPGIIHYKVLDVGIYGNDITVVFRKDTVLGSGSDDLYLTEKELHQLHLDEEALRETLEEQAMDAKAREEKIRQKQADDDEFFLEFGMVIIDSDYESSN
ncbi:transposase, MuDR, MULE transposase domain protein [Tanacetum coccineum]